MKPENAVLSAEEERALKIAREIQRRGYAPYSGKQVGAAIISTDGHVFAGCNVENAAGELGVCAERHAIAAAVIAGREEFHTVIVVSPDDRLWPPCRFCRTVIREFVPDVDVIMVSQNGLIRRARLADLGDRPFGGGIRQGC